MILIFLAFLFISTFVIFVLARHDFVLLRQNISIRLVFDRALIIVLLSLILARILYFIDEGDYEVFIDPLRFLHVFNYWGVSILGIFVGICLGVVFFFRKRKNILRILDIYELAFFPLYLYESLNLLITNRIAVPYTLGFLVITLVLFPILIRFHNRFSIKDGTVGFIVLTYSALTYLIFSFLREGLIIFYSPVQIVSLIVLAISLYCLFLIKINFFKEK